MRTAGEKFAHYEIRSLLGQGGMGEVYLAFDTKLHRRVALKLLLTTESTSQEAKADAVARIIREARSAAAVEHPNKVSIFELGEVEGTPYLAMELVDGSTVRAYVGDSSIDWKQKLGWLLDVARALDAAHDAGLIHRDIKPENVMVRKDGVVKVLDFGIARRADAAIDVSTKTPSIEALTGKGVVIGTAAYMPPEQMHGRELDGRADQFSWGVMAFELLAGKHPWASGGDGLALVSAMLTQPPPRLEGVPEEVADAVARSLRTSRDARFPTMADIVTTLAPSAGSSGPMAVISTRDAIANAATDVAVARTELAERSEKDSDGPSPATPAEKAAKKPRRWAGRVAIVVAALTALVAAAVAVRFGRARTVVEYCVQYVVTASGPRCVGPLPEDAVGRRDDTFKLTSGARGVDTIERLNSAGLALDGDGEPARIEVRRGPGGNVVEIISLDQDSEELEHEVWSEGGTRVAYVEADGKTPRHLDDSRATEVRREFDAGGFVRRELYFGPTGKPRADDAGVFGRDLEHAPDGFRVRETYLGWDEKPMADANGVATVVRVTDGRGVEVEARNLDLTGAPIQVNGVATLRAEYGDALEITRTTFLDPAGAKVANLKTGAYGVRFSRDPAKRKARVTAVDESGRPRQRKDETFATIGISFDERGRRVEVSYLDAADNPVIAAAHGAAIWRYVWNERDHFAEHHPLDPSGRPISCRWGYVTRKDTLDARGRLIELRHFDAEGRPAHWSDGPPISRNIRDERGLRVEMTSFDGDSRPITNADGFARSSTKYDRLRNAIEIAVFGVDGKPCVSRAGFSVERRRFDEDDNRVEVSTHDASGALTFAGESAKQRRKFDERGLVVEEAHFDANDNPVLAKDGYATIRYLRDRSGDIVEESYLGKKGEPIARAGGYAKKQNKYDVRRRRVETSLHDAEGAPIVGSEGWSIEQIAYDERGLVIRESHLDATGKPVVTTSGSSAVEKKYDARGNVVELTTLGADLGPITTAEGYARKKSAHDERDLLVEESLFGADGSPIVGKKGWSVRKLRYDELGNLVDESFFDADRKPVVPNDPPYARKRDKYDARLRLVETSFFDPSGTPAKGPEGAETIRYVRDAYGHAVETAYFDAASQPAVSKEGKQVVRSKYDDAGRLIGESYVDAAGKPSAAKNGCIGRRTKYDELGRTLEEACLDDKAGLLDSVDGWASKRLLRDARGLVVDEATYGADWKLHADAAGIARKKNRYDERGLLQETTFWSVDEKPAKDARGAVAVRFKYDDAGKQIEETTVDDKGGVVRDSRSHAGKSPARAK